MDVNDELDLSGMSATRRAWTERLGAIGEIGRGIGFALVGFFLTRSAVRYPRPRRPVWTVHCAGSRSNPGASWWWSSSVSDSRHTGSSASRRSPIDGCKRRDPFSGEVAGVLTSNDNSANS